MVPEDKLLFDALKEALLPEDLQNGSLEDDGNTDEDLITVASSINRDTREIEEAKKNKVEAEKNRATADIPVFPGDKCAVNPEALMREPTELEKKRNLIIGSLIARIGIDNTNPMHSLLFNLLSTHNSSIWQFSRLKADLSKGRVAMDFSLIARATENNPHIRKLSEQISNHDAITYEYLIRISIFHLFPKLREEAVSIEAGDIDELIAKAILSVEPAGKSKKGLISEEQFREMDSVLGLEVPLEQQTIVLCTARDGHKIIAPIAQLLSAEQNDQLAARYASLSEDLIFAEPVMLEKTIKPDKLSRTEKERDTIPEFQTVSMRQREEELDIPPMDMDFMSDSNKQIEQPGIVDTAYTAEVDARNKEIALLYKKTSQQPQFKDAETEGSGHKEKIKAVTAKHYAVANKTPLSRFKKIGAISAGVVAAVGASVLMPNPPSLRNNSIPTAKVDTRPAPKAPDLSRVRNIITASSQINLPDPPPSTPVVAARDVDWSKFNPYASKEDAAKASPAPQKQVKINIPEPSSTSDRPSSMSQKDYRTAIDVHTSATSSNAKQLMKTGTLNVPGTGFQDGLMTAMTEYAFNYGNNKAVDTLFKRYFADEGLNNLWHRAKNDPDLKSQFDEFYKALGGVGENPELGMPKQVQLFEAIKKLQATNQVAKAVVSVMEAAGFKIDNYNGKKTAAAGTTIFSRALDAIDSSTKSAVADAGSMFDNLIAKAKNSYDNAQKALNPEAARKAEYAGMSFEEKNRIRLNQFPIDLRQARDTGEIDAVLATHKAAANNEEIMDALLNGDLTKAKQILDFENSPHTRAEAWVVNAGNNKTYANFAKDFNAAMFAGKVDITKDWAQQIARYLDRGDYETAMFAYDINPQGLA